MAILYSSVLYIIQALVHDEELLWGYTVCAQTPWTTLYPLMDLDQSWSWTTLVPLVDVDQSRQGVLCSQQKEGGGGAIMSWLGYHVLSCLDTQSCL